ncbi:MAG: hypothetical protein ACLQMH_15565 [Solirubrobacteraceae bacterium]
MSRLPQLRASFMDAAERQTKLPARAARGRRRPLRMILTATLVALLLAAAAVAATGVLRTGSAVRPGERLTPTAGFGVPAPGGSRILGVSFADPAGGPPWGMRVVHTTRDLVCIQLGRLYRGSLGVLGLDGAFHDDGLFHPLPPDVIGRQLGAASCQPEAVRVSLEVSGIPESGLMPEIGNLGVLSRDRWVSYGLLGPDAVSVTYSYQGSAHTVPVEPGTGAYVIVLPGVEPGPNSNGITSGGSSGASEPGGSPLPNPAGALTAITYRLGDTTCQESRAATAPSACPRPQAAPARARFLEPSLHLNRPITVHLHPADVPGGYSAVLTFTAPYAVPNALSGYSIASPTPCHQGTTIDPIDRDVNAGATVTVPLEAVFANACGASVFLEVLYSNRQATPTAGVGSVLVGRAVVKQPR